MPQQQRQSLFLRRLTKALGCFKSPWAYYLTPDWLTPFALAAISLIDRLTALATAP